MSAHEAQAIYVETTIPAGMTMSEYRRSRPRRLGMRARLLSHLRSAR